MPPSTLQSHAYEGKKLHSCQFGNQNDFLLSAALSDLKMEKRAMKNVGTALGNERLHD